MNSTDFERDVRELLQLQGWRVSEEKIVGHKKLDSYAERADSLGTIHRVAVECKAWERALSQKDVSLIFANYYPLIEANLIDTVLLVTINGVSPSALTYVDQTRNLRHLSHLQLLNTLIDFRSHVQGMISSYSDDNVSKYYVPQEYEEGEGTIEQQLLNWIESADCRPIAILGGYGFGKTTLARRLSHILAKQWNRDSAARIPVIISLAAIATDQTLEGLLGRQFTSVASCHNYNFQLFMSLTARGRFVFFLDGFDEMKKTMSWDALMYNLTQLNQLITPRSKVVLLGRPSAFLSSDEQDEALHGRKHYLGVERRIPGWPDYKELHLRPFAQHQVREFIQKYLKMISTDVKPVTDKRHRVDKYLHGIESPHGAQLLDLASRPVQLRMLMELLPEYTGSLDKLTVAILYSEFIDLLLRREASKTARTAFTKKQRFRFFAQLAYWLWEDNQRSDFDLRNIPDSLFSEYLKKRPLDVQPLDIKRDLVSGGFLDRKPPNSFYFPHRSFQEFLVAEQLRTLVYNHNRAINNCPYLTPEAMSFAIELLGKHGIEDLRDWWGRADQPSPNLRDLIRTGCAYYDLEPVPALKYQTAKYQRPNNIAPEERAALLRKLKVVGVLSDSGITSSEQFPKKSRKRKQKKSSREPKYYRRH